VKRIIYISIVLIPYYEYVCFNQEMWNFTWKHLSNVDRHLYFRFWKCR